MVPFMTGVAIEQTEFGAVGNGASVTERSNVPFRAGSLLLTLISTVRAAGLVFDALAETGLPLVDVEALATQLVEAHESRIRIAGCHPGIVPVGVTVKVAVLSDGILNE
jgi:hypothetical protein